jgi:hypothetical protein
MEHAARIEAAITALHDQLAPNAQLNMRMKDAVANALKNAELPPSEVGEPGERWRGRADPSRRQSVHRNAPRPARRSIPTSGMS